MYDKMKTRHWAGMINDRVLNAHSVVPLMREAWWLMIEKIIAEGETAILVRVPRDKEVEAVYLIEQALQQGLPKPTEHPVERDMKCFLQQHCDRLKQQASFFEKCLNSLQDG